MAKTPITAALAWTGSAFDCDELPYFMVQALGGGTVTFDGANLAIETGAGPVIAAPGDIVVLDQAGEAVSAITEDELRNDYEVVDG